MDDALWEFEAPTFVDFRANEHEQNDGAEDYFNHIHETGGIPLSEDDSFLVDKSATKTLNMACGSVKKSSANPICFEDKRHTATVGIVKPLLQPIEDAEHSSKDLNSDQQNDNLTSVAKEEPPTPTDVNASPSSEAKEIEVNSASINDNKTLSSAVQEELEKSKPLSNIVTPSRLASWKTVKQTAPSGQIHNPIAKKVAPLKPARRSNRSTGKTSQPPEDPPIKKFKSNNATAIAKHSRVNTAEIRKLMKWSLPEGGQRKRGLTSEERELAKIEELRIGARQAREENEKFLQKIKNHPPSTKTTPRPHATKPKEFHFKTEERIAKTHSMQTRADQVADFEHDLRKYQPSPVKLRTTVTKPFHFSSDKKRKLEKSEMVPVFVPMAKAIESFHKSTPARFRRTRNTDAAGIAKGGPVKALKVTEPKTPKFVGKSRNRPIATLSAKEKEELELQEMERNQFKANPVKPAILSGAPKLKKIEKKPSTVPVGFHLSVGMKKEKKTANDEQGKPKPFKAQPVPSEILKKVVGVKEKEKVEATVPKSPAFALRSRTRSAKPIIEDLPVAKSAPVMAKPTFYHPPPSGTAFFPKVSHSTTEIKPFSFDQSDSQRFKKKEQKIKEMIEEETKVPQFKAQPMLIPPSPGSALPPKQPKEATKLEPFRLQAEERAAIRAEEWRKQVNKEKEKMRELTNFKANEKYDKVLKAKPFEPKVDHKFTEPLDVQLHSDDRAKQREKFDERLHAQSSERQACLRRMRETEEEKSMELITQMRKDMVHKAGTVRHYKTVEVHKSEQKLTTPVSPQFSTRFNK